ncbi:FixJ family two-component response regulator [Bradyrhizobium japonicum]|jgi:FixJ family two-component response regulator|uniref:FixJ family two-component response regulator n=2 Tax=Bradyrhizobium elkanii TaxID=29448 RepID=A0ABV4FAT7_BRAEL|nr:response regulator transcription factor [Bradyrhizobium elkanii]MBP2432769.1 FixJ family two-component response regulator [Bradyrhizobium elkanii]MCP1733915.1 FixJ family two-component response regulator [Bradyrhizobium elkanii]MCP1751598.1 FixJ family two-component response regulator [Bradyrhizobium elkanii]MCP1977369.1 FixJ family two-component response regulator [Bradyrhizobium elkanii]MCS3569252.1 FixJ family two-component response regulator [Bradyrhizobium elkanii]
MRIDAPLQRRPPSTRPLSGDNAAQPVVLIVDDDASVREALSELILSVGFQSIGFASTRELLEADVLQRPGCLILDVRMPGSSGLDLQADLVQNGNPKPIIFLTGHGDIPMTVQAMKAGAIDFLTKPVRDQALLDAVLAGITMDAARRQQALVVKGYLERVRTLTPREREVLHRVAHGGVNKQIAFELGISEVTVKLHRSNVMRKLQATSIGDLIRIWEALPKAVRETAVDG